MMMMMTFKGESAVILFLRRGKNKPDQQANKTPNHLLTADSVPTILPSNISTQVQLGVAIRLLDFLIGT